jgi:hypothetical protein
MDKFPIQPIKLMQVGRSLYFRIPAAYIHAHDLGPGDYVLPDLNTIKYLKKEDFERMVRGLVNEPKL